MTIIYNPITNYGSKDSLPNSDPAKVIRGTEFTADFEAIKAAFALAPPAADSILTGTTTAADVVVTGTTTIGTVDINGGTIDNAVIGATTPAAGTFSTASTTGNFTVGGVLETTSEIDANGGIKLEDNVKARFGDNSDLQIYHDGSASRIGDTGTGDLIIQGTNLRLSDTATGQTFLQGASAGAVTAYYAGSPKLATTSVGINVTGVTTTDSLYVDGSIGNWSIDSTGVIQDFTRASANYIKASSAGGYLVFQTGGANERLKVNDDGIDVTGVAQMDGLTINRSGVQSRGIEWNRTGTIDAAITLDETEWLHFDNYFNNGFRFRTGAAGSEVNRFVVAPNSDVSFYNAGGTSAKMTWDASSQSLQIGDGTNLTNNLVSVEVGAASPTALIESNNYAAVFGSTTTSAIGVTQGIMISGGASNVRGVALLAEVQSSGNNTDFIIATSNAGEKPTEKMRVLDTGNVGIGTSSPIYPLVVSDSNNEGIEFVPAVTAGVNATIHYDRTGGAYVSNRTNAQTHEWRIGSTTEVMRISDTGNVGIGDADPSYKLSVAGTTSINGRLLFEQDGTAAAPSLTIGFDWDTGFYRPASNVIAISTAGSEKMRIDSSGNVGIGTDTPYSQLTLGASTNPDGNSMISWDIDSGSIQNIFPVRGGSALHMARGYKSSGTASNAFESSYTPVIARAGIAVADAGVRFYADPNAVIAEGGSYTPTERMRVDTSGNVLIGTTDTTIYTATSGGGVLLDPNGPSTFAREGSSPALTLNKTDSDGEVLGFRKAGVPVGGVGTRANYITIGTGDTNLLFNSAANAITPEGDGAGSTGIIDLGRDTSKFQDLYLSGGVYLGGTTAANKLDDYEEGTWTPTVTGGTSGSATPTIVDATYTKVGNVVHAYCYITAIALNTGAITGSLQIDGLPFAVGNNNLQNVAITYQTVSTTVPTLSGRITVTTLKIMKNSSNLALTDADLVSNDVGIMMIGVTYNTV